VGVKWNWCDKWSGVMEWCDKWSGAISEWCDKWSGVECR
jgi:hypothetical protein